MEMNQTWRFIDHSTSGLYTHPLQSFALDDTLCTATGEGSSLPVIRTWVHSNTVMLGIQDSRLPYLQDGLEEVKNNNYNVFVRNSGGLAVVLDEGIFNLSLIFKENKSFSIYDGYDFMWEVVKLMFHDAPAPIEAYEIVGSYCPGNYDLSIAGKKFAGISQRRIRGGVAVQIYMAVTGSGAARARLLKRFYERSLRGEKTRVEYPNIQPEVMASLSELYGEHIPTSDVQWRLLTTFQKYGAIIKTSTLTEAEWQRFDHYYDRIIERNRKAMEKQQSK